MTVASDNRLVDDFREAFTRFAATVSVITYFDRDREAVGMTATSMCSLSLEPLSLLVCVNRENRSHPGITEARRFGVNLLAVGQQELADRCSRPGESKGLPQKWLDRGSGAATPVLRGCVAHIGCDVADVHDAHTHSIFIGHVREVLLGEPRDPLLYCNRAYRKFDETGEDEAMQRVWERVAFGSLS